MTVTLYRWSHFGYITGKDWVKVMTGTRDACEARAAELQAKGFKTSIRGPRPPA
jgi:hypothetical protein